MLFFVESFVILLSSVMLVFDLLSESSVSNWRVVITLLCVCIECSTEGWRPVQIPSRLQLELYSIQVSNTCTHMHAHTHTMKYFDSMKSQLLSS